MIDVSWADDTGMSRTSPLARGDRAARVTAASVTVVAFALVGLRIAADAAGRRPLPDRFTAGVTIMAAAALVAAALAARASQVDGRERSAWRSLLLGVVVMSVGVAGGQAPSLLAAPDSHLAVAVGMSYPVLVLAACTSLYQGLVHWHRLRTRTNDSEWINAVCTALLLIAIGNAALTSLRGPWEGLRSLRIEAGLGQLTALVIVLGAAVWTALPGKLADDHRLWVVSAAIACSGIPCALTLLGDGGASSAYQPLTLAACGLITLTSSAPEAGGEIIEITTQAATAGSLFVLMFGVVTFVVNSEILDRPQRRITILASLAVIAMTARMLSLVSDLEGLARSRQEALTDELTGVANRRALTQAVTRALQEGRVTSLLVLDLDEFKKVNDRYGHTVGDDLLTHLTRLFRVQIPAGALLARLGGDEFAVLLVDADASDASRVAVRLVEATAPPCDVDGVTVRIGASVGVTTCREGEHDAVEMLRRADTAMYQAKSARTGFAVYDLELDSLVQRREDLVEDLQNVLRDPVAAHEQIVVHYQPQMKLECDAVKGAEALVRWQHPIRGLLAPDDFIDLAEENGLLAELTAHVAYEACAQWAAWRRQGIVLRMSVNLSVTSLSRPGLLPLLDDLLARGVDAANLTLELTETSLMADPEQSLATLTAVAARGFGISIDDYGVGYSSLSYLSDLPATELKIDRSFTSRMCGDERIAAVVAGTIKLARTLGMRSVVEGVEDAATLALLRAMGCDEVQGYYYSRPLNAEDFTRWIADRAAYAAPASSLATT